MYLLENTYSKASVFEQQKEKEQKNGIKDKNASS